MELSDSSRLVGLHVLQIEATDQEVVAPDVFGHQVHLPGHTKPIYSRNRDSAHIRKIRENLE